MKLADSLEKRTTALTVSDVAEILHVSVRQVYSLAASSKVPYMRVGGCIRFDPSEFAAWLRQKMTTTGSSSTTRAQEKRCSGISQEVRAATRNCEANPQVEVPNRFRPRRKPSSKARTAAQQQYRFSFGYTGALPPASVGKEDGNHEKERTGSIGTS